MPTVPRYVGRRIIERQVANPVNPNLIRDAGAGAGAFAAIAGASADIAEKMYETDQKTKLNQQVLTAQKDIFDIDNELKQEFSGNPSGYIGALDERLKEYYETTSSQFDDPQTRAAYLDTAQRTSLQYYQSGTQWAQNRQVAIYGERMADAKDQNDILAYRAAQSGQSIDQFLRNAQATKVAGSELVAPEKLQNITEEMQSSATQMYIQGLVDSGKLLEAEAMVNGGEYDEQLGAKGLASMTKSLRDARKKIDNLQFTDPVKHAVQYGGASDLAGIVEAQVDRGVPATAVRVMQNDEAKQAVMQIQQIESPQALVTQMQQLKDQYGDWTPNAVSQLVEAGLPSQYSYAMQMDFGRVNPNTGQMEPGEDAHLSEVYFDVIKDAKAVRENAKTRLKADNNNVSDFELEVFERQQDLASLLRAEGKSEASISQIRQHSTDLAFAHYARFGNESDAIEASTSWIENKLSIGTVNGKPFRIRDNDPERVDRIESGAQRVFDRVEVRPSAENQLISERVGIRLKDSARWSMNYDGTGLRLVDEFSVPLLDKENNIIEYTYDELEEIAQEAFRAGEVERRGDIDETREMIRRAEESDFLFPNRSR